MKGSKHQYEMIRYAVKALEEDVQSRFAHTKPKKKKGLMSKISKHGEAIVLCVVCVIMLGFTLDNLNMSMAKDELVNDRSPAVVEMFMHHDMSDESEEE